MTTTSDPVTRFLTRFGLRDVGHAAVAYGATIAATLNLSSTDAAKASLIAAIPAVGAVAFRQLFPHVSVTSAELGSAVADVEHALAKVKAPAEVVTLVGTVAKTAEAAVADLKPPVALAAPVKVAAPAPAPIATAPPAAAPAATPAAPPATA